MALLGFYGACPNVDISLQYLDQPAVLTFAFTGGASDGLMILRFDLVEMSTERVIASTGETPFEAQQRGATFLAPTLIAIFGHEGAFQIRCFINGQSRYAGDFRINQGVSG